VGGCLNNKGAIYVRLNDEKSAARCFDLAFKEFAKAGDEHGLAVATHNHGVWRLQIGQPAEAITWLEKALAMNSRCGIDWAVASSHRCLGDAYRMLDHFADARSHYRQSLYSTQKSNDLAGQAKSLSRLAKLSLDEGLLNDAINHGEAALAMFDRVQVDQHGTAAALCVLAAAHLHRGSHQTAVKMAREAVRRYQEMGNASGRVEGLVLLGRAQAASGEPAEAANTLAAAELLMSPTDPRADLVRDLLDTEVTRPVPAPRAEDSVGGSQANDAPEAIEDVS
jgi:tetratricopeptide (TPR) repeat protein